MKTISLTLFLVLLTTFYLSARISVPLSSANRLVSSEKNKIEIKIVNYFSDTTIVAQNGIQFIKQNYNQDRPILIENEKYTLASAETVKLPVLENRDISSKYQLKITGDPKNGSAKIDEQAINYTPSPKKESYVDTIFYQLGSTDNPDYKRTGKAVVEVNQKPDVPGLEEFRIYPNPTSGFINVFLPGKVLVEYDISILSPSGEEIFHQENIYSSFPFRFNAENLPPGVYLVRITTEDDALTRRITVK
jgi:hypothetical protein